MRRSQPLLALLALAACESPQTVVREVTVRSEAHAWSAGELLLTSDGFQGAATLRVFLAARSLPMRRLDDSTFAVVLPETTGTVALRVEIDGAAAGVVQATLHGYESTHPLPHFDGNLLAWPAGEGTFLGGVGGTYQGTPQGGRLHRIDPATGTTTRFLDDSLFDGYCGSPMVGVGPGDVPVLILEGPPGAGGGGVGCRVRAVATTTPWTVVDTFPGPVDAVPQRALARLPGGHWIRPVGHWIDLARRDAAGYTWSRLMVYDASRLAASATGELVVPIGAGAYAPDWVPIIRAADLFSPLPLVGLLTSRSAAFSASGDTLFIQRGQWGERTPDSLFVVDPRTGVILRTLPAALAYDELVVDRGRPWLYALTADATAGGATLTIYDQRTMQVVAVQHATGGAPWNYSRGRAFLALDVLGRRLHAVLAANTSGASDPSVAYTFSLMP